MVDITSVLSKAVSVSCTIGEAWDSVPVPDGYLFSLPFAVQNRAGAYRVDPTWDIAAYKLTSSKAYFVKTTGSDGADGLTWATALRSIDTAIAKADADTVNVEEGTYTRSYAWDAYILARSMSIIGWNTAHTGAGQVICTNAVTSSDTLTWTLSAGQTYTYQCTRSNAGKVLDISNVDASGDYQELTLQSSIATVEASAGSYWISGTTVYVHTYNNRTPDASIWVTLYGASLVRNARIAGDVHVYIENFTFIGGYAGLEFDNSGAGQTPELYLKNCYFKHTSGNGLEITGQSLVIAQDCLAARNDADGFNYHVMNSVIPNVIEIGCTGRNNGITGGDTFNGSSAHDGAYVFRVNGVYYANHGPNVIESTAAQTWNVACQAYSSVAATSIVKVDYYSAGGSGTMYNLACTCPASASAYNYYATSGNTVKNRACSGSLTGGAGMITSY